MPRTMHITRVTFMFFLGAILTLGLLSLPACEAGCDKDSDCKEDRICVQRECISPTSNSASTTTTPSQTAAMCGDGVVDPGEECDDGNLTNGDKCSASCSSEPSLPVPDSEPAGSDPSNPNSPVAFSVCNNELQTQQFAPGPTLTLRACAVRYVDANNFGVTESAIQAEFIDSQMFYTEAGTAMVVALQHIDTFQVAPAETDPKNNLELAALHIATRQRADLAHPGECDLVVGYANTLHTSSGAIGGQGTWPAEGLHECLVARSNVGNGQTTAHELGHVFGLFHTFQLPDDGCQDTPTDPNCAVGAGCAVACAPQSLVYNVMSYYLCGAPSVNALSSCQTRRARCFATHMFNLNMDPCFDPNHCNGHGTCDNSICTCNLGYSGTLCDSCAVGFVGYPDCTQNCPANFCSGHGSCSNNTCTCNTGYTGAKCDSCASGYTGYPTCVPNCPANFCNGHGSCSNNTCSCNTGYAGTKCDSCAPGYVGYPNCTTCLQLADNDTKTITTTTSLCAGSFNDVSLEIKGTNITVNVTPSNQYVYLNGEYSYLFLTDLSGSKVSNVTVFGSKGFKNGAFAIFYHPIILRNSHNNILTNLLAWCSAIQSNCAGFGVDDVSYTNTFNGIIAAEGYTGIVLYGGSDGNVFNSPTIGQIQDSKCWYDFANNNTFNSPTCNP